MQFTVVLVFGKGQGKARLLFWQQLSFTTDTSVIKCGVIKVGAWLGHWLVSPSSWTKEDSTSTLTYQIWIDEDRILYFSCGPGIGLEKLKAGFVMGL